MKTSVVPIEMCEVEGSSIRKHSDLLAAEEPLEIRIGFGAAANREQHKLAACRTLK